MGAEKPDIHDLKRASEQHEIDALEVLGHRIQKIRILAEGKSRIGRALDGPCIAETGADDLLIDGKLRIGRIVRRYVEVASEHDRQ